MSDKSYRTGACGNHCEACARRDDRIEQLQAENERLRTALDKEWINVEDRLPERAGYYLVVLNGNHTSYALFNSKMKHHPAMWTSRQQDRTSEVTHWQPLPEPPKEESQ